MTPFQYTPQFLISIERTVTTERLTRYLGAAGNDLARALMLYEYNIALSEAVFGLLQGFEVTIRNAAHHALTASYARPDWYEVAPLIPYWSDEITNAKRKVGTQPGKVVAKLTFGFWVELVNKPHHNTLWMGRQLRLAFPNTTLTRDAIHARLKTVHLLRNRISHHEPVITSRNTLYAGHDFITLPEILECVEWACTDTAHWLRTQFRYNEASRILAHINGMSLSL